MGKYAMVRELLSADGLFDFAPAPFALRDTIALAHDPAYVDGFLAGTLDRSVIRRIGFPWSEALVRRTLASAGGTLQAMHQALKTGWGGTLAGGTHHAFRREGSGFCVFNDIAIAIHDLRARGIVRRAAVIDLDVHQGDGTAEIFQGDPDVLTFSMHGGNNFPFRKQRSVIDIELPDGATDEEYLEQLGPALERVMDFDPEFVFYQAGVDALAEDSLGRLALTTQGLAERDRMVMRGARAHGAPFVITLGGGYSRPISISAEAHAQVYRIAAEELGTTLWATPSKNSQCGVKLNRR
ncbi:MAG: histone deacetylase [Candidatus Solibacter usitatus]|nr:histone deacetylase [Candidatus Solibacter usitatus]